MVATLASMTQADVVPLAQLHRRAFPAFFLSSLGEPFLIQFYRGFLNDASAIAVVARDKHDQACGAAVGTLEPADFFSRLLRRQWPGFVAASLRAAVANPKTIPRLARAIRYRGGSESSSRGALLSSICIDPRLQGIGVGRQLLDTWTEEARRRGSRAAFLTTDAENNSAVNGFYRAAGWNLAHRFVTREGRAMHRYTIVLRDD